MAALCFLALSIWGSDFRRVAREPAFRACAEQVLQAVERAAPPERPAQENAEEALETVKAALTEQYSLAVDSNRIVNESPTRIVAETPYPLRPSQAAQPAARRRDISLTLAM
jgi:hypothetical protein